MKTYLISLLALACSISLDAEVIAPVSGTRGEAGHQDGTGGGARFNDPMGLARDAQGNLYICDARNHVIRKIAPGGIVTTLAGLSGVPGAVNGVGSAARFNFPSDIAVAPNGVLYVADSGNHCIRAIAANGAVTTIAGDLGSADDINQDYGSTYTSVPVQLDGKGAAARFNGPSGVAYATAGFLYVSDTGNQIIRSVNLDGTVTTIAGKAGEWGAADGIGSNARFSSPMGLCIGADGNLYIADSMNHTIRCMTPQSAVSTYAGNPLEAGTQTGPRLDARFCEPVDISPHPQGGFIVCESFGNALFRITNDGNVTLFAGSMDNAPNPAPGVLSHPNSAVCDETGNVYVSDTFNQEVRLIIEKFRASIRKTGGSNQLTITWDSIPGRTYQVQVLSEQTWTKAPLAPVMASGLESSVTFPMPQEKTGIYRIVLLGF
jgi:sugar lactone lactonase YvrE